MSREPGSSGDVARRSIDPAGAGRAGSQSIAAPVRLVLKRGLVATSLAEHLRSAERLTRATRPREHQRPAVADADVADEQRVAAP